ncbi:hypothetical protein BC749_101104 [Flavobacterium araucananum]|uniref:Uncharacterized protein n=1 Tax=Flavobacterium araucananum TaxID=946678 RepID=A0A227PDA3_9FLAO|nr:hypothetical protein [Flavobacterium araucananum]OXG07772.1 hypothetical protein B0A64_07935 [Flavobacterium araucananum]PWK02046.1 hypothetical protein BC749_101104 [Flavobacterium araucananum]
MKNIFIYFVLLYSFTFFGQTKIDENISITFPNKPEIFEINQQNAKVKACYVNSKEDSFIAMKVSIIPNDTLSEEKPKNLNELKRSYEVKIADQVKNMAKKGLFLKDSSQIKINTFLAYKLNFKGKDSDEEIGESQILFLNGITYVFIYSKVDTYSKLKKELFFKSIKINSPENLTQISESFNYYTATLSILGSIIFLYFINKFRKNEKKRNLIR